MMSNVLTVARYLFSGVLSILACLFLYVGLTHYLVYIDGIYEWDQVYDFRSLAFLLVSFGLIVLSIYAIISITSHIIYYRKYSFLLRLLYTVILSLLLYFLLSSNDFSDSVGGGIFWSFYASLVLIVGKIFSEIMGLIVRGFAKREPRD